MHAHAIQILRDHLAELYLTLAKYDYDSSEARSLLAMIDGLKYAIKLLA